jgi:ADP-ribose pyrophosphatase
MKAWKRIEPTKVTNVGYQTIVTKTFVLPDGRSEQFSTYLPERHADVATIAITPDGTVLVFRQFRPGPEQFMDELPGGGAEPDERDIALAARRELEEETGYQPGSMSFVGKLCYDAYSNAWRHYYLGLDCVPNGKGQQLEPNERFGTLLKISIDKLIQNAKQGRMTDSGAILLAYDTLKTLKEKYESST